VVTGILLCTHRVCNLFVVGVLRVGINSGPGDPRTHRDPAVFGSLYTSQLVLGTSANSLAANPLFTHHDASHNVYQLEL